MKTIYNDKGMIKEYLCMSGVEDEFFDNWWESGLLTSVQKAESLGLPYIAQCDLDSGFLEDMLSDDGLSFEVVDNDSGIVIYRTFNKEEA